MRPAGRTCLTVIMNEVQESLSHARQGEVLAEGQLRAPIGVVGRKPMAKRWPDEQESHKRHSHWMRSPISLKSGTCRSAGVYAAGISVKAGVHYPGRSPSVPNSATVVVRRRDALGEVSRGHSSSIDQE